MIPTAIIVGAADAGFFIYALLTWWSLRRQDINRPGQIILGLLVAVRTGELIHRIPLGLVPVSRWTWLLATIFSFLLIYAIYQMGRLLAAVRNHQAAPQRRQPLELLQLANQPGRLRRREL